MFLPYAFAFLADLRHGARLRDWCALEEALFVCRAKVLNLLSDS